MPRRPIWRSGGGGLVSTAHDYMRFCRMMLHGGTLDGVQILSPKTVALFSLNHLPGQPRAGGHGAAGLFSEAGYSGIGFSIGCGVNINVAKTRLPGTLGEYLLGRRCLHRLLDRPEGRTCGGVHDAGDGQRRPADAAPRSAHACLLGDDEVVRVIFALHLSRRSGRERRDRIASGPIPTEASLRSGKSARQNKGWWLESDDRIRRILSTR